MPNHNNLLKNATYFDFCKCIPPPSILTEILAWTKNYIDRLVSLAKKKSILKEILSLARHDNDRDICLGKRDIDRAG
jgi:hypothetical protein